MSATNDALLAWLLRSSVWWAALAGGLAFWFRVRPPQTAAVRHAALATAILAGALAGLLPRWGAGVVVAPSTTSVVEAGPDRMRAFDRARDETLQPTGVVTLTGSSDHDPAVAATTARLTDVVAASPETSAPTWDWASARLAIGALWLLGVLFLSVRLARAAAMAARWRRESRPLPADEREAFETVRSELGVRRRVDAGLHPETCAPLVLCGWPPLVLTPSDWMGWSEASRLAAWRHELAHVRRRDDWWRALSEVLRVIWWFHPGVRWLLSRREHEAELLSDEAAIAGGCPPRDLAQILIDACRRPPAAAWPAPAGAFLAPRTTKARIARLIDATSPEVLCRPAPRALRLVAAVGMVLLALGGSMRWIASATAAPLDGSSKTEGASPEGTSDRVKIFARLIDDATGQPVTRAACEWGLANPEKRGEFIYGFRGGGVGRDGALDMTFDLDHGRLIRFQVLAAGYERAEVVEEISQPTPASLERTVRLKRARTVTGTLRDHEGKPVAGGKVFFIPAGRAWGSLRIVEGVPDSPSVSETRTEKDGSFRLAAGPAGTIAASTDVVDLWAFPMPPSDNAADLVMPAPANLAIDLAYWYLDAPGRAAEKVSSNSDDPNQCWILVDRLGTRDPLVDAIDYHRVLCVYARDARSVSKGVSVGPVDEGARAETLAGVGHNRRAATIARVTLPPGRYLVQRLRAGAGAYAPIDRTTVDMAPGGEASLPWTREEGAAVRGTVQLPANSVFVRTEGEAPRKLDWTIPTAAFVSLRSADGTVRDGAKIQPDGSFFVATHLPPGTYKAETMVVLPVDEDIRHGIAGPPLDLEGAQDFVVPAPPPGPAGSPPVKVEVAMQARTKRIVPAGVAAVPNAVKLSGKVELPEGLLFRRQANKVAVIGPNPRPIGFKGVSVDPEDGRVVEELGWKHVQQVDVFVKANDGREFKAFTKAKADGTFAFDQALPPGGYQVDASAILEMDDNLKHLLGEPRPDLHAGTVLIRVNPGDQGPIQATLKLHAAPFSRRLRHEDPAQRSPELRGMLTTNGKPVADVKVVLYGGFATRWKIADATTDATGKFRFENVSSSIVGRGAEAKHYVGVQIEHPRLVPADGKSWRDLAIPVKPGTVEIMDLALVEGGFIEGRLLAADKTPRAKLSLRMYIPVKPGVRRGSSLFHAYATTDEHGGFRSPSLFPGKYIVEENAGDYPLLGEVVVEAGKTTKLPER